MRNQIDPRAARTKKMLQDAFSELLKIKPLDDVRIGDITSLSGINRSTFYLHYRDIYHLLGDSLLTGFDYPTVDNIPDSGSQEYDFTKDCTARCLVVTNHLQTTPHLALVALKEMNSSPYMAWARDILFSSLLCWQRYLPHLEETTPVIAATISEYILSGALGLLIWWLENSMPLTAEELGLHLATLITNTVSGYYAL